MTDDQSSADRIDDAFIVDGEIRLDDIKTSEEANALRYSLSQTCIIIKSQIEEATQFYIVNGHYRDGDWFRRAKTALAFKSLSCQRLAQLAGHLARQERIHIANKRDERLIALLRAYVGEEAFFGIVRQMDGEI